MWKSDIVLQFKTFVRIVIWYFLDEMFLDEMDYGLQSNLFSKSIKGTGSVPPYHNLICGRFKKT